MRQVLDSRGKEMLEVKNVEATRASSRGVSGREMASETCEGVKKRAWWSRG